MKHITVFFTAFILIFTLAFDSYAVSDSSSSAIVITTDTLEVLYEKNSHQKRSMASTTKIMTGLLLAESGKLDVIITCTDQMVRVEGSAMGLKSRDKVSAEDLLYGLMLQSGNDAANAIAVFLAGSQEGFAEKMNLRAKQLGMQNTNFVTPSGLDHDEHYTTAYDMALLTAYALKNEIFYKVCSSYTATVEFGNPMQKYTLKNHNRLLKSFEGCIGVKTGFTKKSGRCLVTAAERDGKRVIAVTLNDPNDWQDHTSMLNFGLDRLTDKTFTAKERRLSAKVLYGEKGDVLLGFDDFRVGCTYKSADKLQLKLQLPASLVAPIEKNQVVGKAKVYYNDREIACQDVYAAETVYAIETQQEENFLMKIIEYFLLIIKSV